jgi:putative membrane protein
MRIIADVLAGVVALEHAGFLVLEMFLWTKPVGMRIFRLTPEAARTSAGLAMNQGLYNGFLAAGLVWGLCASDPATALSAKTFFLCCVVVAGVFGAATVSPRILLIQAAPALAALAFLRLAR